MGRLLPSGEGQPNLQGVELMFNLLIAKAHCRYLRFKHDDEGIALTEYLILLGILSTAVVVAALMYGTKLGELWGGWRTWIDGETRLGAPTPGQETVTTGTTGG